MIAAEHTATPAVVLKLYHQGGLGVARSLGRLGVPVFGVHHERRAPAARSRYLRDVFLWDLDKQPGERSVAFLLDVARRVGGRPVLVATDDATSMLVADHQDELAAAYSFPLQPPGLARALYSKLGMHDLCVRHGIPTPDVTVPRSRAEVERYAATGAFPVVVKAIDAAATQQRTGVRMAIVDTPDELLATYDQVADPAQPSILLQEYIPGGPESIWMLDAYFDERSECRFSAVGRKVRQYPPATGMASLGVCVSNPEVEELTRRFMRSVGYRGILDCGYRYDERDGRYKLLDVNPRLGATARLFVGADGLDVASALYLDITGQPIPADRVRDGRRWVVENYDAVTVAKLGARGGIGLRAWVRSLRGVEECAWWAADDIAPFVGMATRTAAMALHRVVPLDRIVPGMKRSTLL